MDGDESQTVGPLSLAERRDRRIRARAARIEESCLKKEKALRDERLAKLDNQDDYKSFTLKVGLDTVSLSFWLVVYPVDELVGCCCSPSITRM